MRAPNGQFLSGHSGNAGGRPKDEHRVVDLARSYTTEAIHTLVDQILKYNYHCYLFILLSLTFPNFVWAEVGFRDLKIGTSKEMVLKNLCDGDRCFGIDDLKFKIFYKTYYEDRVVSHKKVDEITYKIIHTATEDELGAYFHRTIDDLLGHLTSCSRLSENKNSIETAVASRDKIMDELFGDARGNSTTTKNKGNCIDYQNLKTQGVEIQIDPLIMNAATFVNTHGIKINPDALKFLISIDNRWYNYEYFDNRPEYRPYFDSFFTLLEITPIDKIYLNIVDEGKNHGVFDACQGLEEHPSIAQYGTDLSEIKRRIENDLIQVFYLENNYTGLSDTSKYLLNPCLELSVPTSLTKWLKPGLLSWTLSNYQTCGFRKNKKLETLKKLAESSFVNLKNKNIQNLYSRGDHLERISQYECSDITKIRYSKSLRRYIAFLRNDYEAAIKLLVAGYNNVECDYGLQTLGKLESYSYAKNFGINLRNIDLNEKGDFSDTKLCEFFSSVTQTKREIVSEIVVDVGPIYQNFLDRIIENENNPLINLRKNLASKYGMDWEFTERDRKLFNEGQKDSLWTSFAGNQIYLEVRRVRAGLGLFVHYHDKEKGLQLSEDRKPKNADFKDF